MKSILVLCIVTLLAISNIHIARAESKFDCLKRVVKETVGDDPKYAAWNSEVDQSNQNAFKMLAMCAGLSPEVQPMCYQNVIEFINGATVTLAKKLSGIDSTKDWATITKPCVA